MQRHVHKTCCEHAGIPNGGDMADLQVFDLQRFALHDGPGIRTTIFVKGCPLDCLWCHNPESKKFQTQLGCLYKNCILCGRCAEVCPENAHRIDRNGHHIDYGRCTGCGKCTDACYQKALKLYGRKYDIEELLRIAIKDRDFYERSGGGITVSGGEPMSQFQNVKKLMRRAKEEGLHTCLDTCGYAKKEQYAEIMEYVDIFLYDYKITSPKKHIKYTGVDNAVIKDNLKFLCENGRTVFLRCPVIPGINDEEEHFQAIAELSVRFANIRQVHIMAYHDMAKSKASQIGADYPLTKLETVEREQKEKIYEKLEALGCLRLCES